jgi:hypothetical protein
MKCTSQKKADLIRIFRIYIFFSCSYSAFSSTFTLSAHFCFHISELDFQVALPWRIFTSVRRTRKVILPFTFGFVYFLLVHCHNSHANVVPTCTFMFDYKCFCMHHVSKYACLHVHIFDKQQSNAAQQVWPGHVPDKAKTLTRIPSGLLLPPHTYTFSSACI